MADETKNLEETLKEKVVPLLDETMEKHWGITIPKIGSNITDKLKNPFLQVYVPPHLPFTKAKKRFKAEFLKKSLALHFGNVSQLAKTLAIDRRSVHRAIKSLDIDVEELRHKGQERFMEELVDKTIRAALDQYKEIIQPREMEKVYSEIPTLSRNIAKFLPAPEMTWKEAEREFERQFLGLSLQEHEHNVPLTSKKLKIRVETLYRKIKRLRLQESI